MPLRKGTIGTVWVPVPTYLASVLGILIILIRICSPNIITPRVRIRFFCVENILLQLLLLFLKSRVVGAALFGWSRSRYFGPAPTPPTPTLLYLFYFYGTLSMTMMIMTMKTMTMMTMTMTMMTMIMMTMIMMTSLLL